MFLFVKNVTIKSVRFACVVAVLLVACESAPGVELTEARQAVSAARAAAAVEKLPSLEKAEKLIFQAETALYGGNYRYARESAEAAKKQALQAQKVILSHQHSKL